MTAPCRNSKTLKAQKHYWVDIKSKGNLIFQRSKN